uniref:type 1 glutamine amidotransferase n=1 Tax=Dietzia sp. TaxID=1871616 RepID=UPI002FD97E23
MGTYGDDGNALILRQRLRWRGYSAEIERITLDDVVPESCDIYALGGGEDSAQVLATQHLQKFRGLQAAVAKGTPVLAICAGMQIFGEWFAIADGSRVPGLGLLDVTTSPQKSRSIGEVASTPQLAGLSAPLLGFENHMGATVLGPDASPLGSVTAGIGNGTAGGSAPAADRSEGVVQGSIVSTYMHGPALSRNPELADLLLSRALGVDALEPVEVPAQERLRSERRAAARN